MKQIKNMQCEDCKEEYRANDVKQSCPRCGGKRIVLVDVNEYMNRVERRAAKMASAHIPV